MAADNPFVRGAPQRSSLNNVLQSQGGVEYHRQRALHAAELYHNTVVGQGDTGGVVNASPSGPAPMVDPTSHGNYNNPYHGNMDIKVPEAGGKPPDSVGGGGTDAYYKQKLRSGFIDLRNSYSEKRKPRHTHSRTAGNNTLALKKPTKGETHHDIKPYGARTLAEKKGLYRSNSSLALENLDYGMAEASSIRRDYGSTSSLDIIGAGGNGEEFFQLVNDYRNEKIDQRAAAPPKVQDLLKPRSPTQRSNSMKASHSQDSKLSNGSVPVPSEEDPSTSPRLKQKNQKGKDRKHRNKSLVSEGGGLLKKLRGAKSEEVDGKVDGAAESEQDERQRKKAFIHLDCQSMAINYAAMIKQRRDADTPQHRNTTTGASAASGVKGVQQGEGQEDGGDGKSNDLVYSCPFFRNELGGEEERTVSLNR